MFSLASLPILSDAYVSPLATPQPSLAPIESTLPATVDHHAFGQALRGLVIKAIAPLRAFRRRSPGVKGTEPSIGALPLVADLLREHADDMLRVRALVNSINTLDDVALLRYVLAFPGDVEAAARAVDLAAEWRQRNADIIARAPALHAEAKATSAVGVLPWRNDEGHVVQLASPCAADMDTLAARSDRWHLETGIANREMAWREVDRETRETGRLVQVVVVQDLAGLTASHLVRYRRLGSLQGELSRLSDVLFSQLVAHVVVSNPPSFVSTLMRLAKPLLSAKLLGKVRLADATTGDTVGRLAALRREWLPMYLGGDNTWEPAWRTAAAAAAQ